LGGEKFVGTAEEFWRDTFEKMQVNILENRPIFLEYRASAITIYNMMRKIQGQTEWPQEGNPDLLVWLEIQKEQERELYVEFEAKWKAKNSMQEDEGDFQYFVRFNQAAKSLTRTPTEEDYKGYIKLLSKELSQMGGELAEHENKRITQYMQNVNDKGIHS